MAKNTFIMAKDLLDDEDLEIFSDEELGQILKAIYRFINHGEIPEFEDKGLYYIFKRFSKFNDENEQKYLNKVDSVNKARESNPKVNQTIVSENSTDISENRNEVSDYRKSESVFSSNTDTVTVNVNDIEKPSTNVDVKETRTPKRTFGEYHHVKLTETEVEKLKADYGPSRADDAIRYLDEYIEMKGYKAKSHYLCIRKWVMDALEERQQKNAPRAAPKWENHISNIDERKNDYSRILANLPDPLASI